MARGNSKYIPMTDTDESDSTQSKNSNDVTLQRGRVPYRTRIYRFFKGLGKRKPVYRITKHGVDVRYFDLSNEKTLPFDRQTYKNTQIFIGNYANPWYVDIEAIEKEYPNFAEEEITTIKDVFAKRHVYPSQRYKLVVNQTVLKQMFLSSALNTDRLVRLLYAVIGLLILVGVFLIFGG